WPCWTLGRNQKLLIIVVRVRFADRLDLFRATTPSSAQARVRLAARQCSGRLARAHPIAHFDPQADDERGKRPTVKGPQDVKPDGIEVPGNDRRPEVTSRIGARPGEGSSEEDEADQRRADRKTGK